MRLLNLLCVSWMVYVTVLFSLPAASADVVTVKSKITDVNTSSDYLKATHFDPQTETTEEIKVDIEPGTHFEGVEALKDLKVGDEVTIEANYNAFTHEWKALSIGPYKQE